MGPADYVSLLHPVGGRGSVVFASSAPRWRQTPLLVADSAAHAAGLAGQMDQYVSCNTFYRTQRIERLAQLGCCYVDLDYYNDARWAGHDAGVVKVAVLEALEAGRCPAPSYVLSSGRGLLVVWLIEPTPPTALPRWNRVQSHLAQVLAPFGVDKGALDPCRVFRVVGTRNGKSGAVVHPVYLSPDLQHRYRWPFDDLAQEVLGAREVSRTQARRIAQTRVATPRTVPTTKLTGQTYWAAVLADLHRLREVRWGDCLPPGQRNTWLLCAGLALSWTLSYAAFVAELDALARERAGWSRRETRQHMSALHKRAKQAAAGLLGHHNGREVEARYTWRVPTLVGKLGITEAEMVEARLRVLVTPAMARSHAKARMVASRRKRGVRPVAAFKAQRRAAGAAAGQTVLALLARLGSVRAVATEQGIDLAAARKRVQRARLAQARTWSDAVSGAVAMP